MAGWIALFKLLNVGLISNEQILLFSSVLLVIFIISLILLKRGLENDNKIKVVATQIESSLISYYTDFSTEKNLLEYVIRGEQKKIFEELIKRFPSRFITSYESDPPYVKGIQIIDTSILKQISKMCDEYLPVAYGELKNYMEKDKEYSYGDASAIDTRISYKVIDKLVAKYPDEFIITSYVNSKFKKVKD